MDDTEQIYQRRWQATRDMITAIEARISTQFRLEGFSEAAIQGVLDGFYTGVIQQHAPSYVQRRDVSHVADTLPLPLMYLAFHSLCMAYASFTGQENYRPPSGEELGATAQELWEMERRRGA